MSDVYHPFNKYLLNPDHVPSSMLHEDHTYSEPGKQLAKPFFPVLVYVTPRLPQFQGKGRLEQKIELEPDNSKGYHDSSIETDTWNKVKGGGRKADAHTIQANAVQRARGRPSHASYALILFVKWGQTFLPLSLLER